LSYQKIPIAKKEIDASGSPEEVLQTTLGLLREEGLLYS